MTALSGFGLKCFVRGGRGWLLGVCVVVLERTGVSRVGVALGDRVAEVRRL